MKTQRVLGSALCAGLVTLGYASSAVSDGYAAAYNNILNLSVTSTDAQGANGPAFIPLDALASMERSLLIFYQKLETLTWPAQLKPTWRSLGLREYWQIPIWTRV